jgi:hypothetical protein
VLLACGALLIGVAAVSAAPPASLTCTGGQSGGTFANVVVPAGANCTLVGVTVKHDLRILAGASVAIGGGTSIGHDLTATGANGGSICATTVGHDLRILASSGVGGWVIGDTSTLSCGAGGSDTVRHDLVVRNGKNTVDVSNSSVGHDLVVAGDGGNSTKVAANTVGHDAVCSGNTGQTGGGNTAHHKNSCG